MQTAPLEVSSLLENTMTFITIFALMGFLVFLTAIIAVCSIALDAITEFELSKEADAYTQAIQAKHEAITAKWEEAQAINLAMLEEKNTIQNLINVRANELREKLAAKRYDYHTA